MAFLDYMKERDNKNENVQYKELKEYVWNKDICRETFEKTFPNIQEPLLIRGLCKNIEAVKQWSANNIVDFFDDTLLTVETYGSFDSYYNGLVVDKLTTSNLTMRQYIDIIKDNNEPPFYYLAEFSLDKIRSLHVNNNNKYSLKDFFLYNKEFNMSNEELENTIYIGKNTTSNCHVHIEHNFLLNQIFGTKTIYLFDYNDNDHIITRRPFYLGNDTNFINERFFELDHSKFKNLYKVVLKPGDSLCIPPWWWHAVRGDDIACSITNIYETPNKDYFFKPKIKWHLLLVHIFIYIDWLLISIFVIICIILIFYHIEYLKQTISLFFNITY